jgi:hypothetical protein
MPPTDKLFVFGFAIKSLKIHGVMEGGTVAGTDPKGDVFRHF